MSTKPLMLEGLAREPRGDSDELMRRLRREKEEIEEQLRTARRDLEDAQLENERIGRSIKALRQQLSPLHRALRAVFGEIELAVGEEEQRPNGASQTAAPQTAASNSRWESYKNSFPGAPARIIDALLSHGELGLSQLSTVCRLHYDTVVSAVAKLTKAGATVKDSGKGGKVRLNQ
jgi:chromosome segregation ATPase